MCIAICYDNVYFVYKLVHDVTSSVTMILDHFEEGLALQLYIVQNKAKQLRIITCHISATKVRSKSR